MYFIVGLGNPGSEYEGTRHNIGFRVIDALADRLGVKLLPGRGDYLISFTTYQGKKVGLVKPTTYMNNSGIAVLDIIERFKAIPENILVVCDDFQLPLGSIRLRQRGSDGGHNGLYSIIFHTQIQNFPRLRCGIAGTTFPRSKTERSHYVLSTFNPDEVPIVEEMVLRARSAALTYLSEGISSAMNKYNPKTIKES
ncbi:MAG: Peptidyl-tRNA hydrolase [Ignavibacteriae bacterium]|nr:MAG: Peptidyl-tRNA hydrolase [Ignavibacteriota bacterium]